MSPYERVLAALRAAGSHRQGVNWQCQSHDDRTPSLSVKLATDGSGIVLMHCHAGCTLNEATAALGLTPADLFPGNGQMALFPKSRYSPIGIDVIRKTPPSAQRTLCVAGALGRYVDRFGGRAHVENTKQMLCVVLGSRHRKAVREFLGLSQQSLTNEIKQWCEWGVAHKCTTGMVTILVRDSESCPLCKSTLLRVLDPSESTSVRVLVDPQSTSERVLPRHDPKATHDGFYKELDRDVGDHDGVRALEYLQEDSKRRGR